MDRHRDDAEVTIADHWIGDGSIACLLWRTAEQAEERPSIIAAGQITKYVALRARAAAVAAALVEHGIQPDDRVAVLIERGTDAAAAFFGVVASGGIAVNINETLRPRQIEFILRHAGARVLLGSPGLLKRLSRCPPSPTSVLSTDQLTEGADWQPVPRIGADPAQIIYTSGSSGLPKGVTVSHANLWAGARAVVSYVGITPEDRIAGVLPFSFDYGFNQLLCAVYTGATLVVQRSPIPQRIVETLHRDAVTVLPGVPPLWHQLLGVERFRTTPVPSLRAMTNTGGRLPVEAVRALRRAQPHAKLFLMFGLTEAFRSTYLPPDEVDDHPASIGRGIPGAQILVLREDRTPCDPNEIGELVHRGPTVALGYWNDPESTARVFQPNPLRPREVPDTERVVFSGDLVRSDDEGRLYHVGRRDGMIKTLGYRVSPDEVAEVLHASGEILEAIISSEPDEQRGARIVAHVVLTARGSVERLAEFCAAEMPRYMQPARFDVRHALPRTTSGKYDVRAVVTT